MTEISVATIMRAMDALKANDRKNGPLVFSRLGLLGMGMSGAEINKLVPGEVFVWRGQDLVLMHDRIPTTSNKPRLYGPGL